MFLTPCTTSEVYFGGLGGRLAGSSVDFRFVERVRHIFLFGSSASRLVTISKYIELKVLVILIMTINIFPRGFYCSHEKKYKQFFLLQRHNSSILIEFKFLKGALAVTSITSKI